MFDRVAVQPRLRQRVHLHELPTVKPLGDLPGSKLVLGAVPEAPAAHVLRVMADAVALAAAMLVGHSRFEPGTGGTLDEVHDLLRRKVRTLEQPDRPRTSASVDSQSVDTTSGGEQPGRDNPENVDGR